jgi:predicted nucleic acid-binding protein
MLVLDATPLIYLAMVDRLDVLDALTEDCVVPQPVYDEVVSVGLDAGHPDARRIERATEAGYLSVRHPPESELADRLCDNPNLSEADAAVIALAANADGVAVMDERYGRATAETEGIETKGTVAILGAAVRTGHLTGQEAVEIVDEMIDAGWYCSTDLYTRIVGRLRELDEDSG